MMQGFVLYTDGGARPNPGIGGWGLHGYLFSAEKPKKGAGNPDFILTDQGYLAKDAPEAIALKEQPTMDATSDYAQMLVNGTPQHREVTPIQYVDGFGTFGSEVSNNLTELTAAIGALEYAKEYDVQTVQVYTDSEYLRKGIEHWIEGWMRNGWVRADGGEIANVRYWRQLVELRDQLVNRGVDVRFDWVKGHTDKLEDQANVLGNILADRLATIGVLTSRRLGEERVHIKTSPADGYWKYDANKHPFLNLRYSYFNTKSDYVKPGEYYLGNVGKAEEMIGKRISDGAFGLVRLKEPDPVIELVREYSSELAQNTDNLALMRLEELFQPNTHREIMEFGTRAMDLVNAIKLDLKNLDGEPITHELRPAKISFRVIESIGELEVKLDQYLAQHPSIVVTDLTPILYETIVKAGKKGEISTTMELKPDYNVGFAALEVDANYYLGEVNGSINPEDINTISVMLTLGIDMLDRNALKRLEKLHPKVSLITWKEAPNMFRYATVVEAGDDKGIWGGVYSNLRIVGAPVGAPQ